MPFTLFDTHIHLDDPRYLDLQGQLIAEAQQKGISHFLIPGTTRQRLETQLSLLDNYSCCYGAIGLHPWFNHADSDLHSLKSSLPHPKIIAIGEIGLDFMLAKDSFDHQEKLFSKQLEWAVESNLPVILHVRKAHQRVLHILKQFKFKNGGIVHAYSGSFEQSREYIHLGFKLGIGGVITHEHATRRRSFCQQLSDQDYVLETDGPDMLVANKEKGSINKPVYLMEIAQSLAELRNQSIENIAAINNDNANQVLRLST